MNRTLGSSSAPALQSETIGRISFPSAARIELRCAHPKISSGWEKKSVMRSRRLRGSSTKVGRAILDRSMPGRTTHDTSIRSRYQ